MQAWLTPSKAKTIITPPISGQAQHSPLTGLGKFPEGSNMTPDNKNRAEDNPAQSSVQYEHIVNKKEQGSMSPCDDTVWQIKAQQLSVQVNHSDTKDPCNDAKQPHLRGRTNIGACEEAHPVTSVSCSKDSPLYHTECAAGKSSIADGHSSQGSASYVEAPHIPEAGDKACSKASISAFGKTRLEDRPLKSTSQAVSAMADTAFSKTYRIPSASSAGHSCPGQERILSPMRSPCTPAGSTIKQYKPAASCSDRDSLEPFLTRHVCLQQLEALWGQESIEVGVSDPWLALP